MRKERAFFLTNSLVSSKVIFQIYFFLIGGELPLNIVLASAIQQHESVIGIHVPSLLIHAPTSHQSLLIYSVIQYFAIFRILQHFLILLFFIFAKSTYSYFILYFSCQRPYFTGFFKVPPSVIFFLFH